MRLLLIASASLLATACSTTPGDAALRSSRPEAAAKLYRQGAEQGDGRAALRLGLLLTKQVIDGYGSPGDWFVKGCLLGEVVACHNAGTGYEYAEHGFAQNYPEAARYYRLAAEKGYMPSQYNLGSLYSNGYLRNDVEGLKWLLISQRQARACLPQPGCKWTLDDEPNHVGKLRSRMSADAALDAERQASAWAAQ